MLNLIAKTTVIHGVKEAWFSKCLGRVIYFILFATSFALMFFQLKRLFKAYFDESVGTRLTNPARLDHAEVPSFYYCNEFWLPNLLGVNELSRSKDGIPRSMHDTTVALHLRTSRHNDTVYPLDRFWLQMKLQDLINGIMMLPQKRRFDEIHRIALRPKRGSDAFYARAHYEMGKMLERLIGSSLRNAVVNNLGGSPEPYMINHTHGIFPNEFYFPRFLHNYDAIHDIMLKQSNRSRKPRLNLDGICWEFSPGSARQKTRQTLGRKHQHVVAHYGGIGRQLAKLVHLYLTTPGIHEMSSAGKLSDAVVVAIKEVLQYATLFGDIYATYVSIATQDEPHLLFDQKIRIDQHAPRVLVKYWTKRSVLQSRKGWPCRTEWSALDQAHCNQRYAKEMGDLFCEQYLPASDHFVETHITKKSCIHDHTGLLRFGKEAARKQTIRPRAEFPLKINSANRQQMLLNLTSNSIRCPQPCSITLFHFQTTYPTTAINQKYFQCKGALAYLFVPPEDIHVVWWGNQALHVNKTFSQRHFKAFMYLLALGVITEVKNMEDTKMNDLPCSVVQYERSEVNGQVSEEYFLYSLSDLAANLGGTMGLWFGVSILSVVQIIYLCCLKKLFKRVEKYGTRRLARCVRRLQKARGKRRNEHDKHRSNSSPSFRPTGYQNYVHHI